MANDARMHVGDVGTRIACVFVDQNDQAISLANPTSLTLRAAKPDGTSVDKNLTLTGGPGQAHYDTEASYLDQPGSWRFQGTAVLPSGTWTSLVVEEEVLPKLADPAA